MLSVISGVIAAVITLLLLPHVAPALIVATSPAYAAMLTAAITFWTLSTVVDFLLIAERKVKYGFVRNAGFSVVKILLLAGFAVLFRATALALFAATVVELVIAFALAVDLGAGAG